MDIIFEFLFEVYLELMMLIVPEEKAMSKKYRFIVILIAVIFLLGILALGIWGIALIVDKKTMLGILPLSLAIILSLAQIIAGIILHK